MWVLLVLCFGYLFSGAEGLLNSVDLCLFVFVIYFGVCLIGWLRCVTVDGFVLMVFVGVWWFCDLSLGWFGVRLLAATVGYLCVDCVLVWVLGLMWVAWLAACIGWLLF